MSIAIFDRVSRGLAEALTLHLHRHEILASNVANLETPGYRSRDLDFKSALRAAFDPAAAGGAGEARVVDKPSGTARPDGNTVDLDMEMARLADNRGAYTTLAEILTRRFESLKEAITGVE